jgi:3,5-epimerase/4-reductase
MFYQIEGIYNQQNEINYNYLCPFINLDIPFENNYILSEQDKKAAFFKKVDYVLLGSTGYLGGKIEEELKKQNKNYIVLNTRLENTDLLKKQLDFYKPKYLISAAGISGKPSTSWCESNKIQTLNTNITYQLTLANICKSLNIHLTILVTGNIYKYDKDRLFKEEDEANNESNYYYKCRLLLEKCLSCYDNILLLRISYPVSLDDHPKCLISKLKNRLDSIDNIKINITVIPELFKNIPSIIEKNHTGLLNFVNKGHIYLHELLKILNIENYKNNYNEDNQFGLLDTCKLESLVENDKISHVFDAIIMNK